MNHTGRTELAMQSLEQFDVVGTVENIKLVLIQVARLLCLRAAEVAMLFSSLQQNNEERTDLSSAAAGQSVNFHFFYNILIAVLISVLKKTLIHKST